MAPEPTDVATRFVEPCWTSPTANTPGRLVSRNAGGRSSGQAAGGTSAPVRTYPAGSRATTPSSQSVRGSAPIMTNSASAANASVDPVRLSRRTRLSRRASAGGVDDLGAAP